MAQLLTPDKVLDSFATIDTGTVDVVARTFEAITSTPSADRDSEWVPVSAFTKRLPIYMSNPVLLLGHQHKTTETSLPIGKALQVEQRDEGLWAKFYVTRRPIGDEVLILLAEGILKGLSCGFVPVSFIPNPSDSQLPISARGYGLKKYYSEVELVEISLLAIPSNRESLVIHAKGGNRFADFVLKGFDGQDVTPILKEWLLEESQEAVIEAKEPSEEAWKGFVNKLFSWSEEEHPRDDIGRFSDKPNSYTTPSRFESNKPMTWMKFDYDPHHSELNKKLDSILTNQDQMRRDIQDIKSKDGWGEWAKKWIVRVAVVTGLYYGIKHTLKNPEVQQKIKNWLVDHMTKGVGENDAIDKLLAVLDLTSQAVKRAEAVGATGTPEYKQLKSFYDRMVDSLVSASREKVGVCANFLETKEMTKEQFEENEHPRDVSGKFRNKSEGAGVKNKKAEHVDEGHEIPIEESEINYKTGAAKGLGQLWVVTKEMTEFVESEHPRTADGKFTDKNQGSSVVGGKNQVQDSTKTNKLAVGISTVLAAGAVVVFGIDLARTSNVVRTAKGNLEPVVEAILNAGGKKQTTTLKSILNLHVEEKDVDLGLINTETRALYDYITNPLQLQKDLAETFGHLNVDGAKTIRIVGKMYTMDRTGIDSLLHSNTMYDPFHNLLNINLEQMEMVSKTLGLSPRRLIEHEYAHSLTMMGGEKANMILDRYSKNWVQDIKSLEGKEYMAGSVGGKIEKVTIRTTTTADIWQQTLDSLRQAGVPINEKEIDLARLKNTKSYGATLTIRENGEVHEIPSEVITTLLGQYAHAGVDPLDGFRVKGVNFDWREMYGLSNLTEYISVKVEKGERIWV